MTADVFAPLAALEGVGSAARAARDAVDVLLRDRGLRRVGSDTTAEALLRGAHASAALAGSPSTLEQVRRGEGDALASGAVRMTGELMGLAPQAGTAPIQVWTRLHQLAAAELGPADQLGHLRTSREPLPDDIPGLPPAPPADEMWERLSGLAKALTAPTTAPGLVVAAIVHAELAVLRPFPTANGLVARAAERVLLVARGIDQVAVTVPEVGHLELGASYPGALTDYAVRGVTGVQSWLLRECEVIALAAERSPLNFSAQ
ncbi:cell filamentation protein Fic [Kribbella sp. ALI-6-A]|uniref:Fic family protein n=1 Tax=Kribbella sp. ALI-6-A TaxID=1933817 RepID=UPI00097CA500|nr:Fic family protein [Kribbella sp. ALI-6-A]ONI67323.1 cell filamentation protein Fic [Kribbella sp. ALI-6-A]